MPSDGTDAPPLKLVITGHVDHGKSTLIGRLLFDTESLPPSKMDEVRRESAGCGSDIEFAFVMDHLEEERRHNVTIDTAQISFKHQGREYVIIDTPGHREFMRNMITGASQSDAAVFVLHAHEGLREQTRRHAWVLSMLGINQVILLINKMDLVDWRQERFRELSGTMQAFFAGIGIQPRFVVPASARHGDNIAVRSVHMAWYDGPTLLEALGQLAPPQRDEQLPLRLPVQDVYCIEGKTILVGRVESGMLRVGQEVVLVPSGRKSRIATIEEFGQRLASAEAGKSIGFTVDSDQEICRGQVVCPLNAPAAVSDRLSTTLFWLADRPLQIDEPLKFRCSTQEVPCQVQKISDLMDSSTLEVLARDARTMEHTQVGHVVLRTDRLVAYEPFAQMPQLGRFVLVRGLDSEAGGVIVGTPA
jgi:bifunctional enzyme CysN/CysC